MRLKLTDRSVDLALGRVEIDGRTLELTTKEVGVLAYLAARTGQEVSRAELLVDVWGARPDLNTRAVDNVIRRLRAKIEVDPAHPSHLQTLYGKGYRLLARSPTAIPFDKGLLGRQAEWAQLDAYAEERPTAIVVSGVTFALPASVLP